MLLKKSKQIIQQFEIADWVNVQTIKDAFTALHYAAFRGNVKICQMLIDNGADMNAKN